MKKTIASDIPEWCSYGYGDGYGDGDIEHYSKLILASYKAPSDSILAFWKSDSEGRPTNGGKGSPVVVGQMQEIDGPLIICSKNALHGTINPKNWNGQRWWVVALFNPVQKEDDKIGSLKRQIIADLGKCPFQK